MADSTQNEKGSLQIKSHNIDGIILLSSLGYVVLFTLFVNIFGGIMGALALIPVAITSWTKSFKIATIYPLFLMVVTQIMYFIIDYKPTSTLSLIFGYVTLLVIHLVVYRISALAHALDATVDERDSLIVQLQNSNQELEKFVHTISHDLIQPVRSMSNFAQLLETSLNQKMNTKEQNFINFIIDGSKRMNNMIDGLVNYSKITKNDEIFEQVNLNEVIKDVLRLDLHLLIEEQGAKIRIDPNLPVLIGSRSLIQQLFQNVISNAIKFVDPDIQPQINISSKIQTNNITITIQDNGIGIAEENHKHIFEIFKKIHHPTKYSGSGIGLAQSVEIMKYHKGEITLESSLGKRSTFILKFPR